MFSAAATVNIAGVTVTAKKNYCIVKTMSDGEEAHIPSTGQTDIFNGLTMYPLILYKDFFFII